MIVRSSADSSASAPMTISSMSSHGECRERTAEEATDSETLSLTVVQQDARAIEQREVSAGQRSRPVTATVIRRAGGPQNRVDSGQKQADADKTVSNFEAVRGTSPVLSAGGNYGNKKLSATSAAASDEKNLQPGGEKTRMLDQPTFSSASPRLSGFTDEQVQRPPIVTPARAPRMSAAERTSVHDGRFSQAATTSSVEMSTVGPYESHRPASPRPRTMDPRSTHSSNNPRSFQKLGKLEFLLGLFAK